MPSLWRLSKHLTLDGKGGLKTPNRWNSRGYAIVYCARSPAGAILEILVHIDRSVFPDDYKLIEVHHPDSLSAEIVDENTLPEACNSSIRVTREIGDQWLKSKRSALLDVPSVIAPSTRNVLLNPVHPDAQQISTLKVLSFDLDPRLRPLTEDALSYREDGKLVLRDE